MNEKEYQKIIIIILIIYIAIISVQNNFLKNKIQEFIKEKNNIKNISKLTEEELKIYNFWFKKP